MKKRKPPRPKRIRCHCCKRLMSYEPYKPGDAVRCKPPNAGHCTDCRPRAKNERQTRDYGTAYSPKEPKCRWRGCASVPVVDRLATIDTEGL